MYPYRVFLSYAHKDDGLAGQIRDVLKDIGMNPVSDQNIRKGRGYITEIKALIDRMHLFVPILTEHSAENLWVHEEIGYAIGAGIPVLALVAGVDPGQMLTLDQAVKLPDNLVDLKELLDQVGDLVNDSGTGSRVAYECPDDLESRTRMLARFADEAAKFGGSWPLRIRAAHSPFCLPNKHPSDSVWMTRQDTRDWPDSYHTLWYRERAALEQHARQNGCHLLIDPTAPYAADAQDARKVRLETLLDFLTSMPDNQMRVVMDEVAREDNLVIVGDWFYCEAISGVQLRTGQRYRYRQSVFTWHAPRVLKKIQDFDDLFNSYFDSSGSSRDRAVDEIQRIISTIPSGPSVRFTGE